MFKAATTATATDRVSEILSRMTLEQKVAQLVGYWVDQGDDIVAPMAGEMRTSSRYEDATAHGIGHLTRVYGTRPVDPLERAAWLRDEQSRIRSASGHGIGAIVHEECLTGLAAWKAATFPTPLAWGASFDADLVETMAAQIGASMRELGIHQGLAPVLDVIRDVRWGRVDECIAEDPFLVGRLGTAYVTGLQSSGVHATLKHFVGYSASQSGRNHAPVHAGPREIADVFLPPFEMAVREGGVRSVMNSYAEIDGVPVAADPRLLTQVLREAWGFTGTVVADYFSVAFLHSMHRRGASPSAAARLALEAGIDVELPTGDAFPQMLEDGTAIEIEDLIDRAVTRVLTQKEQLGLLDESTDAPLETIELDSPAHRATAYRLASESIVLLANDGVLPLASDASRIAVVGPNADEPAALMGCYSFANHVLTHHAGTPYGFEVPTVAQALRSRFPDAQVQVITGCGVEESEDDDIEAAVAAAEAADVVVAVVGDRAGLFGVGTVGEGNDVESLALPGAQRALVEAAVATGTPVVVVVITGRPYELDWALDGEGRAAAVLQSFFPGEEGASAIVDVLAGAVNPSGRLPVSLPRSAGAQPYSYLHPTLGGDNEITSADSSPVRPFGFGLSYTTFRRSALAAPVVARNGDDLTVTVTVQNIGDRAGTDVVQIYAHLPYRSVTRPVAQLVAFARVSVEPGESVDVCLSIPPARLAYSDVEMRRVVEPGPVELWCGPDSATRETAASVRLEGPAFLLT